MRARLVWLLVPVFVGGGLMAVPAGGASGAPQAETVCTNGQSRETFTFTYGGLSHGGITGTFDGDYYSGTVAFEVLEGDCVTTPITKARIAFAGTWHPYRAHS